MRILQIVKTSEGAAWAACQVEELVRQGLEVHVALPDPHGQLVTNWKKAGAAIHIAPLDFPLRAPWRLPQVCEAARKLVADIAPDLIHTHHVGTTLVLRRALGKYHPTPRIFQVPGPLHLEHALYRKWEISSAGPGDFWIGNSKCIVNHYERAGVAREKVFLSYAGNQAYTYADQRSNTLRNALGIGKDKLVVGNINFIYAPKYYLGQRVGLKCHEDVIQALAMVIRERSDVIGVLLGGAWGKAGWYE